MHFFLGALRVKLTWKKIFKKIIPKIFTGQPSNDPKHPDFRPQIFQNRDTDLEKLQDDLNNWNETRHTVPPVIEVTAEGEKLLQVYEGSLSGHSNLILIKLNGIR